MSDNTYRGDGSLATKYIKADRDDDFSASKVDDRMRSTSLGSMAKKGKGPAPLQKDYNSTAEWSAALRRWRETPDPEGEGQKRALARR